MEAAQERDRWKRQRNGPADTPRMMYRVCHRMYLTSCHEPRYKRSASGRTPRHEEKEPSEDSSSEEEGESSGRCTEESEDASDSQDSDSGQKDSECSAECGYNDQREAYTLLSQQEKFNRSGLRNPRILKQDKVTQKNLLSPFPSFTLPMYREVTGPPLYRLMPVRPTKEMLKNAGKLSKQMTKRKNAYEDQYPIWLIHKNRDRVEKKPREKNRKDKTGCGRVDRSQHIFACMQEEAGMETPGKIFRPKTEPGNFMRHPSEVPARKPRTAEEEANRGQEKKGGRPRRKTAAGASNSEGRGFPAAAPEKSKRGRNTAAVGVGGGQVREKLVYVVEEKGKDITKLETDLFTLNEILAIKKDLLELSEFAKKLKQLKEMKKQSENGRKQQNPCQCPPAAELLKDVNRRIEALEARQEELERGSKFCQKEEVETDSKNSNCKQTSSNSQSKTALVPKSSAMTTVLSFPKMEMIVSRGDVLSNNSDIVNELMDIKTQLQKLEKKRMTKENSEVVLPGVDLKPQKKEDPAIAVFSSRTYILTESMRRRQKGGRKSEAEKANTQSSPAEEKSRSEDAKEHVTNWLNSVSTKPTENELSLYVAMSELQRDGNEQVTEDQKPDLTCKNCSQILKERDFENQEPNKNRASNTGQDDVGVVDVKKESSSGARLMKYKECIVTPSGKIFAWVTKSNAKLLADPPVKKSSRPQARHLLRSRPLRRSDSSGSIPSAVLTKEQIQLLKGDKPKSKSSPPPKVILSRSLQELSVDSSAAKTAKTARNVTLKKIGKVVLPKEKKHKDDKNHFLKLLEAHLLAFTRSLVKGEPSTSTCSYSEFLASVNLETDTQTFDTSGGRGDHKPFIMTYTAATEADDLDVEELSCDKCRKRAKRRRKEQKIKESMERKQQIIQKQQEGKKNKNYCKELKKSLSRDCCSRRCDDNCKAKYHFSRHLGVCCKRRTSEVYLNQEKPNGECLAEGKPLEDYREKKRDGDERYRKKSVEDCTVKKKPPTESTSWTKFPEERNVRNKSECEWYPKNASEDFEAKHYQGSFTLERLPEDYLEAVGERHSPRGRQHEQCSEKRKPPEEHLPKKKSPEEYHVRRKPAPEHDAKKTFKDEELQVSPGKNSSSVCFQSEDSLQILRKSLEHKNKSASRNTSVVDTCRLKNFVKNLSRLYPKINSMNPISKEYCEIGEKRKKPQQQKDASDDSRWNYYYYGYKQENEEEDDDDDDDDDDDVDDENDDDDDDDDDDDEDEDPNSKRYKEISPSWNRHCKHGHHIQRHSTRHKNHHNHSNRNQCNRNHGNRNHSNGNYNNRNQTNRAGHLNNCKCVRVYLQSQLQRGWSGLRPFRKFSTETITEESTSRTEKSSKSIMSDIIFPRIKSQTFQVAHAKEAKKGKKDKQKDPEKNKKKHSKKQKSEQVNDGQCKCKKCGNVHAKGPDEDPPPAVEENPPQSEENPPQSEENPTDSQKDSAESRKSCRKKSGKKEVLIQETPNEKKNDDMFPLFSFLSSFCKSKPRQSKSSKFSLKKLSEVRNLKNCPLNMKRKRDPSKKKKKGCDCEGAPCECNARLTDIENRLSELESKKTEEPPPSKKKGSKKKPPADPGEGKKKAKKEKKKRGGENAPDSAGGKKPSKKDKKSKKKKECPCGCHMDMEEEGVSETPAYYQTVVSRNSFSRTLSGDRRDSLEDSNRYRCPEDKSRLPSLHSFWKSLRKYKKHSGGHGTESPVKKIKKRKREKLSESQPSTFEDCSRDYLLSKYKHFMDLKNEPSYSGRPKKKTKLSEEEKRQRKEAKRQSKRNPDRHKSHSSRKRRRH